MIRLEFPELLDRDLLCGHRDGTVDAPVMKRLVIDAAEFLLGGAHPELQRGEEDGEDMTVRARRPARRVAARRAACAAPGPPPVGVPPDRPQRRRSRPAAEWTAAWGSSRWSPAAISATAARVRAGTRAIGASARAMSMAWRSTGSMSGRESRLVRRDRFERSGRRSSGSAGGGGAGRALCRSSGQSGLGIGHGGERDRGVGLPGGQERPCPPRRPCSSSRTSAGSRARGPGSPRRSRLRRRIFDASGRVSTTARRARRYRPGGPRPRRGRSAAVESLVGSSSRSRQIRRSGSTTRGSCRPEQLEPVRQRQRRSSARSAWPADRPARRRSATPAGRELRQDAGDRGAGGGIGRLVEEIAQRAGRTGVLGVRGEGVAEDRAPRPGLRPRSMRGSAAARRSVGRS